MHLRLLLSVLAAASALAAPAAACQSPVAEVGPGSPLLRTGHFRERADTFDLLVNDVPAGTAALRTRLVAVDGRAAVVRVETLRGPRGEFVGQDSFVVLRESLAPLADRSKVGDEVRELAFAGRTVRVSTENAKGKVAFDTTFAVPPFHDNSLDLLLGALPLRAGFTARVPVYEADGEAQAWVLIRVAGLQSFTAGDGRACRAWRVEADEGGGAGTYWIEERSRTLLAYRTKLFRLVRRTGCEPGHAT